MLPVFGFREHPHTADWELEVWAPDLCTLLEQAARGMYSLSGMRLQPGLTHTRSITLLGDDAESLLVRFLTELLWLEQEESLGFDKFNVQIDEHYSLQAELSGSSIASLDKEIKAVTYHNLEVKATSQGLWVTIVFDV
jgi:SHS2 domain-containing protein